MKPRIATFNVENLDDIKDESPTLPERIAVLRPQLQWLQADVICFQEVHGQEAPGQPRRLLALQTLLQETAYADYHMAHTLTTNQEAFDQRNLVIISRFPLSDVRQCQNELIPALQYRKATAVPAETASKEVRFERPILYAKVTVSVPFPNMLNT